MVLTNPHGLRFHAERDHLHPRIGTRPGADAGRAGTRPRSDSWVEMIALSMEPEPVWIGWHHIMWSLSNAPRDRAPKCSNCGPLKTFLLCSYISAKVPLWLEIAQP